MVVKTRAPVVPANAPYLPPPLTQEIAWAIRAIAAGEADPGQQAMAIKWIVFNLCKTEDMSFRSDGPHPQKDQDFAEGKKYCGQQIRRICSMSVEDLALLPRLSGGGPSDNDGEMRDT
jgi:hypothetical protein